MSYFPEWFREFFLTDQENFQNFRYPSWTFDRPNLAWADWRWTNCRGVTEISGILPDPF